MRPMKTVRKIFVVDTSLLLHDPRAILSFDEHIVVVPFPVLEELDAHKRRGENGTATAARQVIRILDGLREKGEIHRGIETPGGGILLVDTEGFSNGVKLLDVSTVDNFIISVAMKWRSRQEWLQKKQGREKQDNDVVVDMNRRFTLGDVVLITKDINLRVKAGACKVAAQDYLKDRAASSQDELYTGLARIVVSDGYFEEVGRSLRPRSQISSSFLCFWLTNVASLRIAKSDRAWPSTKQEKRIRESLPISLMFPSQNKCTGRVGSSLGIMNRHSRMRCLWILRSGS